MRAASLEVKDLTLRFGGVTALKRLSFSADPGELLAIIGPNGAGKTSVFNCVSGVYEPSEGEILLDGEQIIGRRPHQIARQGVARVFQNVELFARLTVLENVLLGCHHRMRVGLLADALYFGRALREELRFRHEVEEILDFLELEPYRRAAVGTLPFGVQKRVELARALAMKPRLLLLDEPVGGMNIEETEDMARFILDIREQMNLTMVLIEHDMGVVMDISDRVVAMHRGTVLRIGTPSEVQADAEVVRSYLGGAREVAL